MSEKKCTPVSSDDRNGLEETRYLLQSPKNAQRLLSALARSRHNEGAAETIYDLKKMVGL